MQQPTTDQAVEQPTLAGVVLYTLTEQDAALIASRRAANAFPAGILGRYNAVSPGETYPAVVVRTFGGSGANLRVLLDGDDTYWATSRTEGQPGKWGHWAWPTRD